MSSRDITDLVIAARTGGPRALTALAKGFSRAVLHLPLETLQGIKNRPDTALELGDHLPVHWLQLQARAWAVPVFTRASLCRECADVLSWQTDGRAIKTLAVPGSTALEFFELLFRNLEVDRVILNPTTDAELHLARTDVEALKQVKERVALWFYTRGGHLKQPVTIGEGSLMSTFLAKAGGALRRLTDATLEEGDERDNTALGELLQTAEILGSLQKGPLANLSAAIYQLLLRDPVENMELVVRKKGEAISVEAQPYPGSPLLQAIERAAREHLTTHDGDIEARFNVTGSTIVMQSSSSSSSASASSAAAASSSSSTRARRKVFDYIPLEPEAPGDD